MIRGSRNANSALWNSIRVTFRDDSYWDFLPVPSRPGSYRLVSMSNLVGSALAINRDSKERLASVASVYNATSQTLMEFEYSGLFLSRVKDVQRTVPSEQRAVFYSYGVSPDRGIFVLKEVSRLGLNNGTPPSAQWKYTYFMMFNRPVLQNVATLNPNDGTTYVSNEVRYNSAAGRADKIRDANGQWQVYDYLSSTGVTKVKVLPAAGGDNSNPPDTAPVQEWTQRYTVAYNRNIGAEDAANKSSSIVYDQAASPYLPSYFRSKLYGAADVAQTKVLYFDQCEFCHASLRLLR